jgi:hypothetical protein
VIAAVAVAAVLVSACGAAPTPGPSAAGPTAPVTPDAAVTPTPSPPPEATSPSPTAGATATPRPSPTPAPSPTASSTVVPSPGADTPTPDTFWTLVERGIRAAGTLEIGIDGPNAGTLRFEPGASATVIEDVVGFVCVGGRAYDGQSAFTRLPGRWTCGAPALVAGFRGIGQPIDAWNATIPTDTRRRERLEIRGDRWTWTYRANSPFYGGAVTATVILDRSTRRVVEARRTDPTGATTYDFRYGSDFPPIAVPR